MTQRITFIGGGNMTTSLVSGLSNAGRGGCSVTVIDHNREKLDDLAARFGVETALRVTSSHLDVDAVVLAVKPQSMPGAVRELAPLFGAAHPLILSIAAGITLSTLRNWLDGDFACVRCMPNTASLLGVGATGLYADAAVTPEQRKLADDIMTSAGLNVWVDNEQLIDAVTATSGSGLAYFFAFMEAMIAGARKLGLEEEDAHNLVLQTALGSARMATESGQAPAELRRRVTSKGGTTAAALACFENGGLSTLVDNAMQAASDRAAQLADAASDNTQS